MSNFKTPRIRDPGYLAHVRTTRCMVPDCTSSVSDAAHLRGGQTGGMGLKPSDDLVLPLCRAHHQEQHGWPQGEINWWYERFIKETAQKRYRHWLTFEK